MRLTLEATPTTNSTVAKKFPEFNLSTTQGKRNIAILVSISCIAISVIFGGIAAIAGKLMIGSVIAIGIGVALVSNPIIVTIFGIAVVAGIIGLSGFISFTTIAAVMSWEKPIKITPEFLKTMENRHGPGVMDKGEVDFQIKFIEKRISDNLNQGIPAGDMLELQKSLRDLKALKDHLDNAAK